MADAWKARTGRDGKPEPFRSPGKPRDRRREEAPCSFSSTGARWWRMSGRGFRKRTIPGSILSRPLPGEGTATSKSAASGISSGTARRRSSPGPTSRSSPLESGSGRPPSGPPSRKNPRRQRGDRTDPHGMTVTRPSDRGDLARDVFPWWRAVRRWKSGGPRRTGRCRQGAPAPPADLGSPIERTRRSRRIPGRAASRADPQALSGGPSTVPAPCAGEGTLPLSPDDHPSVHPLLQIEIDPAG